MSKTKNIQNTEELLNILSELETQNPYPGFSWQFLCSNRKQPRIKFSVHHEFIESPLQLVVQPTRSWLQAASESFLFAPHIPSELASDYRKEGIAHGDLNGRLFYSRSHHLIDIRPEATRYKAAHRGPDLFAPKPSRVIRCFLARQEHLFTQEELTEHTGASRALISQVLKQLVSDDYVEQTVKGSRAAPAKYRLKDFDNLLEAWERRDQWEKRVTVHQFSIFGTSPEKLAHDTLEVIGEDNIAFTQWVAAWNRRPHTTPSVVSAYIKNPALLDVAASLGRPVKTGGNLWLMQPKDEGVFLDTQEVNGLPLVCDAQIYLDLIQAGLRGPEAAKELRAWENFSR